MKRIICIGNRYVAADAAGPLVYDYLRAHETSDDCELIDGGLAGLNLLGLVEDSSQVVFVDSVMGWDPAPDSVIVLDEEQVTGAAAGGFDHAAGLPYLLRALRAAGEGPGPEITLVGVQGIPHPAVVAHAASVALKLLSSREAWVAHQQEGAS